MEDVRAKDNVYWMLLQVAIRTKHGLMKLAEAHDLTVMQLYTLCLMNVDEPIPTNSISCMLYCDASNVTGIVERLFTMGYIIRKEKPEDRRVKMVELTSSGIRLRNRLLEGLFDYELPEFHALSQDQRAQLTSILSIVLQSQEAVK
jgi:DNA-binding MarR family transcriptional regulator